MNKQEFLARLRQEWCELPPQEIEERVAFYSEMIDDRMEEGLSEEAAVASVDTTEETLQNKNIPPKHGGKKRRSLWEILLLVLGAPVWVSILLAAVAVVAALYITAWSVIVSLWSVVVSFVAGGGCAVVTGLVLAIGATNVAKGMALLATGLVLLGLSIFCFLGSRAATVGLVRFTKFIARGLRSRKRRRCKCV